MKRLDIPVPLGLALAIAGAWLVAHALGGRDAVSVLSGTMPDGPMLVAVPLGVVYVVAWLGTVVLVPPLVVAAAAGVLAKRAGGRP